jgi:hypothetical protein
VLRLDDEKLAVHLPDLVGFATKEDAAMAALHEPLLREEPGSAQFRRQQGGLRRLPSKQDRSYGFQ